LRTQEPAKTGIPNSPRTDPDEEIQSVLLADIEDRNDIGMPGQGGRRAGLVHEARHDAFFPREIHGQNFDGEQRAMNAKLAE
jgi:hypothetical protein